MSFYVSSGSRILSSKSIWTFNSCVLAIHIVIKHWLYNIAVDFSVVDANGWKPKLRKYKASLKTIIKCRTISYREKNLHYWCTRRFQSTDRRYFHIYFVTNYLFQHIDSRLYAFEWYIIFCLNGISVMNFKGWCLFIKMCESMTKFVPTCEKDKGTAKVT